MGESVLRWTRSNAKVFPFVQIPFTLFTLYILFQGNYSWKWWAGSVFVYFLTGCLGITITFHRYLTHRSFKMPKWMEYLFSWFGAMGGTGSAIGWVAVHHEHHKNADRPGDPHSPAISGWRVFFPNYEFELNRWAVRSLITNRFHKAVHDYYIVLLSIWAGVLFAIDPRVGIFGFVVPITIQVTTSVLSNYFNHHSGYRNFETNEDSTNSAFLAAITWGEGWHNNHHKYPNRWNFRIKWWEFDPSGMVIGFIRMIYPQTSKRVRPQAQQQAS